MTQAAVPTGQTEATPPEEQANPPLNRREFLNIAWLSSLGFLTVALGAGSVIFGIPRFREGEFGGIVTVGRVADLPPLDAPPSNYPKVKMWISNGQAGLLALYKVCVHLGCIYAWNDQEFKFICPCHGSQYQHNGDWILGPAPRSLDRFVITIEDENGNVLAQTPADGGPVQLPNNPNAVVRVNTGAKILGEVHD